MNKEKGISTLLIILIIVGLIVVVGGGIFTYQYLTTQPIGPTVCTKEAKVCPDGSSVYRTEPNCEFTECPATVSGQLPINIKPNQTISLPFTLTGKAGNVFEGEWGNVKMYDSLDNLLITKIISIPCDYGKLCDFSVVLDGMPKTNNGYLIFSESNPSGLPQYENSYRIDIGFNNQTAGWKTYTNTQFGFEVKYPSSWSSPFGQWGGGWTAGESIDNNNYCVVDVINGSVLDFPSQGEISNLLGKGYLQTSIKIGGVDGIRLTRSPSGAGLTEAVYFSHKDANFRIGRNRGSGDKIENECINTFNQIFSTFKFTK